ncbi:MAG: rod shape-determining protein MreC [Desulfobulbaceae bacterium]|nr:rod shape-determining protein MreC [Desulfobulbaceae bacterium]
MKKRGKRTSRIKHFLFISTCIVLFGVLIISFMGRREFTLPHKLIFDILGTAQAGVTGIIDYGSDIWANYIYLIGLKQENDHLKEKILEYQTKTVTYREALATNARLSKLLKLKETLPAPKITARIIGHDPSQWFKTFTIDRSRRDGVMKGMPVITTEGVVGQILDGGNKRAKVLQTIDPNSAIEVRIQDTRTQGIIKGTGTSYRLLYVPKNNEVHKGDLLITSGLGGVFPQGIPVAVVSSVVSNRRGMFLNIEAEPVVDFSRLENVIVIMKSNQLAE